MYGVDNFLRIEEMVFLYLCDDGVFVVILYCVFKILFRVCVFCCFVISKVFLIFLSFSRVFYKVV